MLLPAPKFTLLVADENAPCIQDWAGWRLPFRQSTTASTLRKRLLTLPHDRALTPALAFLSAQCWRSAGVWHLQFDVLKIGEFRKLLVYNAHTFPMFVETPITPSTTLQLKKSFSVLCETFVRDSTSQSPAVSIYGFKKIKKSAT